MSDIITKIQNKIKYQEKIPDSIQKINDILANNIHLLEENEIVELRNEKNNLEKRLIKSNLSIDEKFSNFFSYLFYKIRYYYGFFFYRSFSVPFLANLEKLFIG